MGVQPSRSWTKLLYATDLIEISDQETVHTQVRVVYRVHMLWGELGILPYFPLYGPAMVPVIHVVWNVAHLIYDMAGWGKVDQAQSTGTERRYTNTYLSGLVCMIESTQVQLWELCDHVELRGN